MQYEFLCVLYLAWRRPLPPSQVPLPVPWEAGLDFFVVVPALNQSALTSDTRQSKQTSEPSLPQNMRLPVFLPGEKMRS